MRRSSPASRLMPCRLAATVLIASDAAARTIVARSQIGGRETLRMETGSGNVDAGLTSGAEAVRLETGSGGGRLRKG